MDFEIWTWEVLPGELLIYYQSVLFLWPRRIRLQRLLDDSRWHERDKGIQQIGYPSKIIALRNCTTGNHSITSLPLSHASQMPYLPDSSWLFLMPLILYWYSPNPLWFPPDWLWFAVNICISFRGWQIKGCFLATHVNKML